MSNQRIEDILIQMWSKVFEKEDISAQDDFFDLGGHSLMAAQLVTEIREVFEIELSLLTFFDNSTVSGLAETISQMEVEVDNISLNQTKDAELDLDEMLAKTNRLF